MSQGGILVNQLVAFEALKNVFKTIRTRNNRVLQKQVFIIDDDKRLRSLREGVIDIFQTRNKRGREGTSLRLDVKPTLSQQEINMLMMDLPECITTVWMEFQLNGKVSHNKRFLLQSAMTVVVVQAILINMYRFMRNLDVCSRGPALHLQPRVQ